ncbi:UNVERIFIED_ORG: putative membrane protein [Pseudomonas reinekei]|nr:putative membrane protein [Pseudomonas reinekei]
MSKQIMMDTDDLDGGWLERNSILLLLGTAIVFLTFVGYCIWYHFQLGGDIPILEVKNTASATYWGQLGDFVGGMLNPLLSFLALIAVVISIKTQSKELKAARAEARAAQSMQAAQKKILERQNEVFEQQSFESVFFGLLQMHSRNVENVSVKHGGAMFQGVEGFARLAKKFDAPDMAATYMSEDEKIKSAKEAIQRASETYVDNYGYYFGTLEQIFSYIDSYGSPLNAWSLKVATLFPMPLQDRKQHVRERYARVVASILSPGEIDCVCIYSLSEAGVELKKFVDKYDITKKASPYLNQYKDL